MKRFLLFSSIPLSSSLLTMEKQNPLGGRGVSQFAWQIFTPSGASSPPECLHDLQASTPWADDHPPPLGRSIDFCPEAKGRCRDGLAEEAS